MSSNTSNTETLKRAIEIAEQIEALQAELDQIIGNLGKGAAQQTHAVVAIEAPRKRRKMSSQRDQGTKPAGGKVLIPFGKKKKRTISAEGRARIVEAVKRRWANARK